METENSPGKPRRKKGIVGSLVLIALLLSVAVFAGITAINFAAHTKAGETPSTSTPLALSGNLSSQVNVSLQIQVFNPDGSLASTHQYPNDIITNQLISFLGAFFEGTYQGNTYPNLNNLADVSTSTCGYYGISPFDVGYSGGTPYYGYGDGGYIGIGTGSTTPARTDYNLQTQVGSWVAANTPTIIGNSVVVASGVTLTSGATISEAGFAEQFGGQNTNGVFQTNPTHMFLFFHDTFTGFAVSADQTVQIQYTLNFPSGSNQNLLAFFATMMQSYTGADGANIGPMVNSAGATFATGTLGWWNSAVSSYTNLAAYPSPPMIEVGTSATSPTPTDYQLNAQVGSIAQTVTETTDTTTNYRIIYQNSITLSSSYTIQEVGFFYDAFYGGNYNNIHFLMFHNTFTGVAIPSGNAITAQVSVGF